MKDITLLASFVAPSLRQKEFNGNYVPALSPLRKLCSGNNCAIRSGSVPLFAQPAVDMDTASVASSMVGQAPQAEPLGVYEAVLPQTETLVGMGFILVLCVALYWVWENQVVPVSRTKLAISKSRGEVKDYLDELKASAPSSSTMDPSVQSLSAESISPESVVPPMNSSGESSVPVANLDADGDETKTGNPPISPSTATSTTSDRSFERWLFTDWLQDNKSERKGGRQKEPALPILKDAKWNSGDNPVVVAAFLMLVGLVVTTLTERLASFG